jgi:phage portal protein BeeE
VSSGWAAAAAATVAVSPTVAAASPFPRSPVGSPSPVRWEIATEAGRRISTVNLGTLGTGVGPVSESEALTVPAYAQGVAVIAGSCASMPMWVHRGEFRRGPVPSVIANPDPDLPPSIHWTAVFRDLVQRPYSWCLVTARGYDGFPASIRHLPFDTVSVRPEGIYYGGTRLPDGDVVRFDSPNPPGALIAGARVLRTSLLLEEAARRFANMDVPAGYLKQTGGPDLMDEEIDALLSAWEMARRTRMTGFLTPQLDYETPQFDPAKLQLVEARQAVTAEVARLLNLPPTFVNAETGGSLTYSTVAMQQEALRAFTLWPYLTAVRERLSMGDVTPRGTVVEYPSLAFLRTDLTGRAEAYRTLIDTGVLTPAEVRQMEQLPPVGEAAPEEGPSLP